MTAQQADAAAATPRPSTPAPAATYRLQLRAGLTLHDAARLLPYLHDLGITHLYLSPVAQAREGSEHGYDVLDPRRVDPALGGQKAWEHLAREAARHGVGLVVDIVPDHLAAHADNEWWRDVLRHGPASRFAPWFDVDWDTPALPGRVLLPLLQRPLPDALTIGEVRLALHDEVTVEVAGQRLPLDPATYPLLLDGVAEARDLAEEAGAIPPRIDGDGRRDACDRLLARLRERLGTLLTAGGRAAGQSAPLRDALRARIGHLNGPDGHGHALLLLDAQAYALAPWREAPRRIRHRRFFDINDLVGLRPHLPDAFQAMHAWLVREAEVGRVHGVRVDHVDGLGDPQAYLQRLRAALPADVPVFVEKITAPDEALPDWPVDGTTGYDAMAHIDALQVDPHGLGRLQDAHIEATRTPDFPDVAERAGHLVMERLFPGILDDLARRLRDALDEAPSAPTPPSAPATPPPAAALRTAVAAVTANLPVYRTYTRDTVRPEDRTVLEQALAAAREHHTPADADRPGPTDQAAALDALARVLLHPATEPERRWVLRWQQWSPAVHAKAVEDTALYRAATLLSLNEVGQEPDRPPLGVEAFLRFAAHRALGGAGLTATSTHDTKMSEDVRARLHTLSHRPEAFVALHHHLRDLVPPRTVGDRLVPGPEVAWRLHQTLLGAWPLDGDLDGLSARLREHVVKMAREAKLRTDWLEPDEAYEAALQGHADRLVRAAAGDDRFLELARVVALHGMVASLAAVLLRCTLPGTPDLYQGMESWRFLLVDPDNRGAPDLDHLRRTLRGLDEKRPDPAGLFASWPDGHVKLHATAAALRHRRDHPDAYAGDLVPCPVAGVHAEHAVAYLRRGATDWVLVVVPRLTASWSPDAPPVGAAWGDATVPLPPDAPGAWRDALTGRTVQVGPDGLRLAEALETLPVALLGGVP